MPFACLLQPFSREPGRVDMETGEVKLEEVGLDNIYIYNKIVTTLRDLRD